jgi:hypothetical protein
VITLLFALGLFALCLIVHILWWRLACPRRHRRSLVLLFSAFFLGALCLSQLISRSDCCSWLADLSFLDWVTIAFLYGSLFLCYVITYPAIEADSPTLSLMFTLSQRGAAGMTHEEVRGFLERHRFINARIGALVTDGFLVESDGLLTLSDRRFLLFRLLLLYRRVILGIRTSGG